MKQANVIITAVLLSLLAAFIMVKATAQKNVSFEKKESAYDRVIQKGTIRCGFMMWPPFFQKDEKTGELSGMTKEAIDEIFFTIGIKVEYVEAPLGNQPQDLAAGKYDSFCFDSFLTPKAAKFLDYSKAWLSAPMYLYGRQDFRAPAEIDGLNSEKYSFSAMDGDSSSELASRRFPKAKLFSLPATADPSLLILNITTNKSDIVITDPATILKFNKTNESKLVRLYNQPIADYPILFSVKKGELDLKNMLDYAVDIFVHTGQYDKLLEKYDPNREFFIRMKE